MVRLLSLNSLELPGGQNSARRYAAELPGQLRLWRQRLEHIPKVLIGGAGARLLHGWRASQIVSLKWLFGQIVKFAGPLQLIAPVVDDASLVVLCQGSGAPPLAGISAKQARCERAAADLNASWQLRTSQLGQCRQYVSSVEQLIALLTAEYASWAVDA